MATPAAQRSDIADHLFTQAVRLPPSERDAFLRDRAGANSSLLTQVASMLHHFDRISGFLESPLQVSGSIPLLVDGQELAGRFRIERFIARGGMGEVYAAHDRLLKESVAVKTIGAFGANEPWLIEHFRDEIRLGRKISHRNICRIHDIHEQALESGQNLLFFAMELLEGETLAAMMAREGAMPVSVADPIIRQILSGLGEAHATGIVHGDFKPANVILTRARAVITDFGLAQVKMDSAAPVSAESGILAGSLPYMAPEQFVDSQLSPAADLFSVGVVMYEMVMGQLPFPVTSIDQALEARLAGSYRAPEQWRRPITRCLSANARDRPRDVQEILRQMGGGGIGRRSAIAGGVAALACAVYGGYRSSVRMEVAAGMPVLLLDAADEKSKSGSPVVDQLLRTQLNQSAHFEILDKDRIKLALERMGKRSAVLFADRRTAREVALREGSPLLISTIVRRSGGLQLEIEIEKLGSHPYFALRSWSRSFRAESEPDLRTAASAAAGWIRQSIGEHADELARRDRRPEEATTSSWESLLEFVEAERARSGDDDPEAIRRLRQALAIDEAFPLAQMRLAEFLLGLGRIDEGYTHWMRAAKLVEERHLTDRESFRIRALFLHDIGDYAGAEKVMDNWAADFPNSYLPYFYLASCQKLQGRPGEALNSINTAYSKAPGNPHVVLNRAQLHMEQGRLQPAKADLDTVRKANVWWWQYQAEYNFVVGEYRATWDCFNHLASLAPEWRSKSFSLKACLLFECGQGESAIRLLQAGVAYDRTVERLAPNLPGKLLLLASGALKNGKRNEALSAAREAALAGGQSTTLLRAAALLAEAGDRTEAEQMAARTVNAPVYPVYRALRLQYEAAMASTPGHAAALLRNVQGFLPFGSPRSQLARALDGEGFQASARGIWIEISRYSARYWLNPDRHEPAVFRDALIATAPSNATASTRLRALDEAGRRIVGSSVRG